MLQKQFIYGLVGYDTVLCNICGCNCGNCIPVWLPRSRVRGLQLQSLWWGVVPRGRIDKIDTEGLLQQSLNGHNKSLKGHDKSLKGHNKSLKGQNKSLNGQNSL